MSLPRDPLTAVLARFGMLSIKITALNPMIWIMGIGGVLCVAVAAWFAEDLVVRYAALGLAGGLVVIAVLSFLFLLGFDRDRLQGEEHRYQMAVLERAVREPDGRVTTLDHASVTRAEAADGAVQEAPP